MLGNLPFGPLYKAMQVLPVVDYILTSVKFAKWHSTNCFNGCASKTVFFTCKVSTAMEFLKTGKATGLKMSVAKLQLYELGGMD